MSPTPRTRMIATLAMALLVLALALALAGPVLAATRTVSIENFRYSPNPIRISVGDAIRWRNDDPVPHTATARNGSFDTGLFLGGRTSDAIVFRTAGAFEYFCETHPDMSGRVVVAAVTGPVPPTDTAPSQPGTSPTGPVTVLITALLALAIGVLISERRRPKVRDT